TIHRPEARNAINLEVVNEMHAVLSGLADDARTRVLILTGSGRMAFASGADIRELRDRRAADALRGINSSLFMTIERFPLPTIAAVSGYALGGGCELALAASAYGPDAGHVAERLAQAILFESADKREGMTAFLEGRPPRFAGK